MTHTCSGCGTRHDHACPSCDRCERCHLRHVKLWYPCDRDPHTPTDRQLRQAERTEDRWLQINFGDPADTVDAGRLARKLKDHVNRYSACAAITASRLIDAQADVRPARPRPAGTPSNPTVSNPTLAAVYDTLDLADTVKDRFAHLLGPCRLCPHDGSPDDTIFDLVDIGDPDLPDDLVGRSVIQPSTRTVIEDVSQAHQDAAQTVADSWNALYAASRPIGQLTIIVDRMRRLKRRMSRLADTLERVSWADGLCATCRDRPVKYRRKGLCDTCRRRQLRTQEAS